MKTLKKLLIAALSVTFCQDVLAQSGDTFDLSWSAIGGGGTSAGGAYSVSSTIGQPDAGTLNGGIYTMEIGFWSIVAPVNESGRPLVTITRAGTNLLISWPSPSSGFSLEQNPVLMTANWTAMTNNVSDDGNTRSVTLRAPPGNRFYR